MPQGVTTVYWPILNFKFTLPMDIEGKVSITLQPGF